MNRNFVINAVEVLRAGGLVAMPTETVYGLGADARNVSALRKIFLAKQRPMNHPLIVHLAEISQLEEWADDISETGLLLAKAYWPGPLTLIFKKAPGVNDLVTGGQETIGLRIPHHPVAQALLQAFGGGIAAPSANRFGRISPTTAKAVYEELGDSVDLILEGGQCSVGVESTIVDVSGKHPTILRPGMITAANIEEVLHSRVIDKPQSAPRVSGSMESHYAPATKIRLIGSDKLKQYLSEYKSSNGAIAVMSFIYVQQSVDLPLEWVSMPRHVEEYAHNLYQVLRELDKKNFQEIVIEEVPETREWDAIRDRLQRASGRG